MANINVVSPDLASSEFQSDTCISQANDETTVFLNLAWELHSCFSPTLTFKTDQHEGQQTDQHEPCPHRPTLTITRPKKHEAWSVTKPPMYNVLYKLIRWL